MGTAAYATSLTGGGQSINGLVTRSPSAVLGDGPITLPVGQPGALVEATSSTGTVTMTNSMHGITTGEIVDVYWATGTRYGVTVGTVSGASVPISGGSGTNIPSGTSAVVVTPQVPITITIPGPLLEIIGIQVKYINQNSTAGGHLDFQSAVPASITTLVFEANECWIVDVAGGATNPFSTSTVATINASNNSATEVGTLTIIYGYNSTPSG